MNVLAVAAHWDDIELGCGITLKKLSKKGHNIFTVVICSSQYGKHVNEGMKELIYEERIEWKRTGLRKAMYIENTMKK